MTSAALPAAAADAPPPMAPAAPPPPPTLASTGTAAAGTLTLCKALSLRWARMDARVLSLVSLIELAILVAGLAHGTVGAAGVCGTAVVVALNLVVASLAAHSPRRYSARWRLPLMMAARSVNMVLFPAAIDLLSVMAGQPVPAASTAATAAAAAGKAWRAGRLAAAALYLRGAAFFVVPVAGVHACLLMALYCQLPPLPHLAVQLASVAFLLHRTPAVCSQLVAMHPAHACLAEAAYWVVRHLVALVCPGTWLTLETAADEATPVEKCAAVAWVYEVGLGLVLATLLAWQQQLLEVQELAVIKAQLSEAAALEAREELLSSPYVRMCEPALRLANAYKTWVVPVGLSALAAFIAALVARPGADGA